MTATPASPSAASGPASTATSRLFRLRAATPADGAGIVELIGLLAEYEQLTSLLEVTPASLEQHLFGPRPAAEAWVAEAEDGSGLLGFALAFTNFSTFLGRPGLYLEDLYVRESARGLGVGRALLRHLAAVALARDYGRFEWSVLDWNAPAIRFYEAMGATVMPDWRICRVTGEALRTLGADGPVMAGAGEGAGA